MVDLLRGRRRRATPWGTAERVDLVIVSYSNPRDLLGGAEQIAWAEAGILAATRRVVFLSASTPVEGGEFPQVRIAGWTRSLYQPFSSARRNLLRLGLFHLLSLFNPVAFVESLLVFWKIRPRVVHTHNLLAISPAVWLAARLSGARVLHTHHDLWLLCERATMTDSSGRPCSEAQPICRVCRALRGPKRIQLGFVSAEIFPSRWLRDRLARMGEIVPSFATSYRPKVAPSPRPTSSTLAYIGGLTSHKLGVLLEAFDRMSAETGPPWRLAIAGAGPLAREVARAAEKNPRLEYLGPLDAEARDSLLDEAALFVLPSTWPEVSPLVFFEALSAGLPIVASEIGGIVELERFGNVVLVPPGDVEALARALAGVLGDEKRMARLRAEAWRQRGAASPESYSEAIAQILERVGLH